MGLMGCASSIRGRLRRGVGTEGRRGSGGIDGGWGVCLWAVAASSRMAALCVDGGIRLVIWSWVGF